MTKRADLEAQKDGPRRITLIAVKLITQIRRSEFGLGRLAARLNAERPC